MSQRVSKDSLPWEPYDGQFCSQQASIHMESPYQYLQFLQQKRKKQSQSLTPYAYAGELPEESRTWTSICFYLRQKTSHIIGTNKTPL